MAVESPAAPAPAPGDTPSDAAESMHARTHTAKPAAAAHPEQAQQQYNIRAYLLTDNTSLCVFAIVRSKLTTQNKAKFPPVEMDPSIMTD